MKMHHNIISALKKDELVLFIGAGFSKPIGFPDWKELVLEILHQLSKDTNENYNHLVQPVNSGILPLLNTLDLIKQEDKTVRKVLKHLFDVSCNEKQLNRHKKIWQLTDKVITTNFDYALESAVEVKPVTHKHQYEISQISKQERFLFKIHGSADDIANCVLYADDYENLYNPPTAAVKELENIIRNKTILFIGFSLSDPYVAHVFSYMNYIYHGFLDSHFILTTDDKEFFKYNVTPEKIDDYSLLDAYLDQLIQIKNERHNLKTYKPLYQKPISDKKKKRFLRRRCRLVASGSKTFKKIVSQLMSDKFDEKVLEEYRKEILELEPTYEMPIALAAYHENIGKIEHMEEILDSFRLRGSKESTRLLYKAIALEKQDKIDDAIENIYHLLIAERNFKILRAAQFNLNVCFEKKEEYSKVEFTTFFSDKNIISVENERLFDKALSMHLIVCIKTGSEFLYKDQLVESLDYEVLNSPTGYIKTLLTYYSYKKTPLPLEEIERMLALSNKMSINSRAAMLYELSLHIDKDRDYQVINKILKSAKALYELNQSSTVKKYLDEIESCYSTI